MLTGVRGISEDETLTTRDGAVGAVSAVALLGGLFLTYDFGTQMVNFGALICFMGVNAAAFTRYYLRAEEKRVWMNLVPPVLGFLICLLICVNLEAPAKLWGGAWVLTGILYGAGRTSGFRKGSMDFELPPE